MFSWGDWRWSGTAKGFMMNTEGQIMASGRGEIATDMSNVDQYKYTIKMDDVQVGGSAQTTAALGLTFRPLKGLRLNDQFAYNFGIMESIDISYISIQLCSCVFFRFRITE